MAHRRPIPSSVRTLYPKSANKTITVRNAWRPFGDRTRPEPNGPEGWTHIGEVATIQVLQRLWDEGYIWVNLEAGGVAWPFKDAPLSSLI